MPKPKYISYNKTVTSKTNSTSAIKANALLVFIRYNKIA